MSDIIEAAARALYLSWFPDAPVDEHFQWYHDGAANPDSCVHSSNVAKALKDVAAVTPLIRAGALDGDVLQNDLRDLLDVLGMPSGAQPRSPHEVFRGALEKLRAVIAERDELKERLDDIEQNALERKW